MPVFQINTRNLNALNSPGVYFQIIPPSQILINGVPTNILGVVGIASWGPVNSPVTISDMQEYTQIFGPSFVSKYEMGIAVAAAFVNGANNFRCVRVTDGTDTAASVTLLDGQATPVIGATITSKYTGETGSLTQVTVANGSQVTTLKVTITMPNLTPEVFDNIPAVGGAYAWNNIVAAINTGISGVRGPSQLVVATLGTSASPPALTPAGSPRQLGGGSNGTSSIDSATLVGDDTTIPRKGMYALRNTGVSIFMLANADDATKYDSQISFANSEGAYGILTCPAGQSIDSAISVKHQTGVDDYNVKLMLGDWAYFYDTYNQKERLISQQAFTGGRLANLSPEQSGLNKKIAGIIATQSSRANKVYSAADIVKLSQGGLDVIANNPSLGNYYALQTGQNTSSIWLTSGDEYTRLTNFIAYTCVRALSPFIGQLHTVEARATGQATLESFFEGMKQQGLIGDVNGGPAYSVILDNSNNPPDRVALGYFQADVQVVYQRIIRVFLVNFQGGQVQVTSRVVN